MLNLKKVAVTGGLSSGKSTVCNLFEDMGAYVVSADKIVHQLLSPETTLGKQILDLFGNDVMTKGKFNRQKIADRVFNDPDLLTQLEKILHPAVFEEVQKAYSEADTSRSPLFVAEIPLLFETGQTDWFDCTIAVDIPDRLALQRYMEKGGSAAEFKKRAQRQLSNAEKAKKATITIKNDQDLATLKKQIAPIFQQFSRDKIT